MADSEVQSTNPRVIKRYANRKLYDTRDSRYVTLPQIAELVRNGEDVQIIDNRTKENLTSVTLAQIIYGAEKNAEESSKHGTKTLRDLIQAGGERLMAQFRAGPVGRLIPRTSEDLRDPKRVIAPALEALEDLQRRADERLRAVIGNVVAPLRELSSEISRLQARIEELESRLIPSKRDKGPKEGANSPVGGESESGGEGGPTPPPSP
ncbi:MAG: polyhydroxyalkanoate synthesis regulator DNA-binding domain-containing protein [Myxococcales bacterium]